MAPKRPERSPVPVPIGGGMDNSAHRAILGPPRAADLRNLAFRERGALMKVPGTTRVALVNGFDVINNPVMVPAGRKGVLLAGDNGTKHIHSEGSAIETRDQVFGGLVPTSMRRYPATTIRGAAGHAQIAHAGGFTAVMCSVGEDPTIGAGPDATDTLQALCVILDEEYRVAWGPFLVEEMGWFPRVEAVYSAGVPSFVFMGIDDPNATSSAAWSALTGLELNGFAISTGLMGTTPPTASTITNIDADVAVAFKAAGGPAAVLWDSYSPPDSDLIYLAYYNGTAKLATLNASLTLNAVSVAGTGGVNANESVGVWYDTTSNTALLYLQETNTIYWTEKTLVTALASVAYPAALTTEPPMWYLSTSDGPGFDGRLITITGSGPGTPSIGGGGSVLPLDRRPQAISGADYYHFTEYTHGRETDVVNNAIVDRKVFGGQTVLRVEALTGGGVANRPLLYPNATREPLWYEPPLSTLPFAGRAYAGANGQSARTAAGKILVPQIITSPGALPAAFVQDPVPEPGDDYLTTADVGGPTGVASRGPRNAEHKLDSNYMLVVNEIENGSPTYSWAEHRGTQLVASGIYSAFDGEISFEGVLRKPDALAVNASTTYGGAYNTARTSATLKAVFVYTDRNGVKYRSPSFLVEEATETSGGASDATFSPQIDVTLHPSQEVLMREGRGISVELYIDDSTGAGVNYTFVHRTSLIRSGSSYLWSNGDIQGNTGTVPLYDETELPTSHVPPSSSICSAGNRVFLLPSDDAYEVWPSKSLSGVLAPEFSPVLAIQAPPETGGVVALAGHSDRVLLLGREGIYELFVLGAGPDASGSGDFPPMRRLWLGDGCATANGVVTGPFGTFYIGYDGPKIINPGGELRDVGEAVRGLVDPENVRAAVWSQNSGEIWLFMTTTTLVYDWELDQWARSTQLAKAAAPYDGEPLRLDSSKLLRQSASDGQDDADDAPTNVLGLYTSPWLKPQGTGGYFRVQKAVIAIDYISGDEGKIVVEVAYNYDDAVVDTFEWTADELAALGNPYLLEVGLSRQKASAYKITVREDTTTEQGESPEERSNLVWGIMGIDMLIAVKSGVAKLAAGATN